jgi:hypothetical protein
MLRLRLAFLALASGMLMTVSGCLSSNSCYQEREPIFHRLFRSNRPTGMDCECCQHGGQFPQTFDVPPGQGPFIGPVPGAASGPIPITNTPGTPPIINRIPNAAPTPFNPPVN